MATRDGTHATVITLIASAWYHGAFVVGAVAAYISAGSSSNGAGPVTPYLVFTAVCAVGWSLFFLPAASLLAGLSRRLTRRNVPPVRQQSPTAGGHSSGRFMVDALPMHVMLLLDATLTIVAVAVLPPAVSPVAGLVWPLWLWLGGPWVLAVGATSPPTTPLGDIRRAGCRAMRQCATRADLQGATAYFVIVLLLLALLATVNASGATLVIRTLGLAIFFAITIPTAAAQVAAYDHSFARPESADP